MMTISEIRVLHPPINDSEPVTLNDFLFLAGPRGSGTYEQAGSMLVEMGIKIANGIYRTRYHS
jgi:hypothetical protein